MQENIYISDSIALLVSGNNPFASRVVLWNAQKDSINTAALPALTANDKAIFGSQTILYTEEPQPTHHLHLNASRYTWYSSMLMLVMFCIYIYIIYRYKSSLSSMFKVSLSIPSTLELQETITNDFNKFLNINGILSLLLLAAMSVTVLYEYIPTISLPTSMLFSIAAGGLLATMVYRYIATLTIRLMGAGEEFCHLLLFVNRFNLAVVTTIITPVFVVIGLGEKNIIPVLWIILLLVAYHFTRLYKYFILSGFSILQWILYLCAVEVLPVSYLIALAERSSRIT